MKVLHLLTCLSISQTTEVYQKKQTLTRVHRSAGKEQVWGLSQCQAQLWPYHYSEAEKPRG